jgi:hypothetical protein
MGAAEWDSPEIVSLVERTMHGQSPTTRMPTDEQLW